MKKINIHILIVLGLFLITFILGSFIDLKLMEAVFSKDNTFGIFCSTIGTIPGYGVFAFMGGAYFSIFLKNKEYKPLYKTALVLVAIALLGVSIFFSGREFFSENGFMNEKLFPLGFVIALPIMCGLSLLGYLAGKRSDNPRLWLVLGVMALVMFFALVPGVTLLKSIFHRPRFRIAVFGGYEEFHNWWEPCSNYKDIIASSGGALYKEEFKSFPSGHAGAASCTMILGAFLPFFGKDFKKYSIPVFYAGLAWTLFIAFTRILVGAHFLSDVSMGALLTVIFLLIGYTVVVNKPKLFGIEEKEEQQAE